MYGCEKVNCFSIGITKVWDFGYHSSKAVLNTV